ncbi:MAG: hypothetical protein M1832_000975 [Thelocarpon impressellum]|nr:MAG: hypothetical protein M1832_000975 [Thelocarpon impressellum]
MATLPLDAPPAEIRSELDLYKVLRESLFTSDANFAEQSSSYDRAIMDLEMRLSQAESGATRAAHHSTGHRPHSTTVREVPCWGDRLASRSSTPDPHPTSDSYHSLENLPSRKRPRETSGSDFLSDLRDAKSRRTTPSPQFTSPTTPSSSSSFGLQAEDLKLLEGLGDGDLRQMREQQKEYERLTREKLQQELWDASFAKTLQEAEESARASMPSGSAGEGGSQSGARPNPWIGHPIVAARSPLSPEPPDEALSFNTFFPTNLGESHSPRMPGAFVDVDDDDSPADRGQPVPMSDLTVGAAVGRDQLASLSDRAPDAAVGQEQPTPLLDLTSETATGHEQQVPMLDLISAGAFGPQQRGSVMDLTSSQSTTLSAHDPFSPGRGSSSLALHHARSQRPSFISLAGLRPPMQNASLAMRQQQDIQPGVYSGVDPMSGPSWLQHRTAAGGIGQSFPQPDTSLGSRFGGTIPSSASATQTGQAAGYHCPYGARDVGGLSQIISNNPFSIVGPAGSELLPTAKQAAYIDYVTNDPTKTRDELKSLLENIRPDAELPAQSREGTPEAMKYPLMPHQKLGIAWMKKMEGGSNKGGILADDMGLGKTIQALALMVSRPSTDPERKTTLIVAPVALLKQWEREILTKLKPGHRLRTFLFHGSRRNTKWKTLREYDVVLTTFGTLASEYKRLEAVGRGPDAGANLSLLGTESRWYRVIVDEAQCIKNRLTKAAQGARQLKAKSRFCLTGTPMMNNVGELHSLIEFLRIGPYNEGKRFHQDFSNPLKSNWQETKDQAMRKLQALLKAILLRRTKKSKIDGLPIINLPQRTDEVRHAVFDDDQQAFYTALETQSQLQFNRYLRQGTVGRHYSNVLVLLLRLRQACCHPHLIQDFAQEGMHNGEISVAQMEELARQLSPEVVSRIREAEAFECPVCYDAVENPAIFIPCGHDTCAECFAKISDQSNMQGLAEGSERAETKCPQCRGKVSLHMTIDYKTFRKVHKPEDVEEPKVEEVAPEDDGSETEGGDEDDSSEADSFVVSDDESSEDYGDGETPFDKAKAAGSGKSRKKAKDVKGKGKAKEPRKSLAELKKEGMRNVEARRRYMRRLDRQWVPSAKVDKCCEILEGIQNGAEGEKTIVFSQFTSLLDLLEVPIARKGWGFKRYDGSMTAQKRNDAVMEFTDRPECKIMLVSLKAGNAGLNLVAASQVIILDPFWNPFIEEQAVDRTHRIGQLRPVRVHRLLVQNTVEDRIVALQEKKRKLIEAALDEKASQGIGRLSTRELTYLFGMG